MYIKSRWEFRRWSSDFVEILSAFQINILDLQSECYVKTVQFHSRLISMQIMEIKIIQSSEYEGVSFKLNYNKQFTWL